MSLTEKQRRFVDAYLREPNGTKAAIAAGYAPKSAAVEAARLLSNAKVAAELSGRRKLLEQRTGITPERVLLELAKLGFSDIRDVVQWRSTVAVVEDEDDGEPGLRSINEVIITDSEKLSDDAAAAVLEVSQTREGTLKVKLHDKVGALVKIGQHLGMFRPVAAPGEVGKKEAAQEAARTAGEGTGWGDDLRGPAH